MFNYMMTAFSLVLDTRFIQRQLAMKL